MSTTRNTDTVEVIMRDQRRRRWSLAEKRPHWSVEATNRA